MTGNKKTILDRSKRLYVAAFSDAADEVGLQRVSMDCSITPVTKHKRLMGFARTGKLVRSPVRHPYDEEQFSRTLSLASDGQDGDILIIDSNRASDVAAWGHVLTTIARSVGIRGAIIDGNSRDVADIDNDGDFAVFARGRHPGSTRGRFDVESINQPIVCGGVAVNPEDFVFADGDGIVVIPKDQIAKVLDHAEKIAETDDWWIKELKKGRSPHDINKERSLP